jgi:ATP-dependent Lon protease
MSVSSIYNSYNYTLGLDSLTDSPDETGAASVAASKSGSKASNAYSGNLLSTYSQKALQKAVAALKAQGESKVTFDGIEKYRRQQEADFSAEVRKDLRELGVDEKIQFQLVARPDGSVSVITTHADKARIEQYLQDNPDMVEKIQEIQALSNRTKASEAFTDPASGVRALRNVRKELQAQAVQAFFEVAENSGTDFASQIASFDSDGGMASYLMGLNTTA